jgi:serine/threonine protein kinase
LGGYQIRSMLGKGGMAIVYLGVQMSLNRPVAIKVLNSNYASNQAFVRRFDAEAGALASLNHPNIVNIIDKGFEGRHYYFVMEHVEGCTLEQLIQSVDLSFRHYVHIVSEISRALTYVHSKKVIHRDIKPSNIMVTSNWHVKVGDFGIAHIVGDEEDNESNQPRRRATVGTAFYMAPEQATHANQVDQRADVYSLGVTFYKMFTRTLPQKPVAQWPPVTEVNHLLPLALDPVLRKAMDSYPDQRYSTVAEFCNDIIRVFQDHMEGRAASTSALIESSAALFQKPYHKVGAVGSGPAVQIKGSSASDSTGGGLAVFTPLSLGEVPTLGISGTSDSRSVLPQTDTPTPLPEGTASISKLAQLDAVLSGLGDLGSVGSAPVTSPGSRPMSDSISTAKTEPAPVSREPESSSHAVSVLVWVLLILILAGAGYLLYLAFNQGL